MHLGRKHFFHHFQHHIAAFFVGGADYLDMFIQKTAFADFVRDILIERRGVQISALLGHYQFANYLLRGNDPCQA